MEFDDTRLNDTPTLKKAFNMCKGYFESNIRKSPTFATSLEPIVDAATIALQEFDELTVATALAAVGFGNTETYRSIGRKIGSQAANLLRGTAKEFNSRKKIGSIFTHEQQKLLMVNGLMVAKDVAARSAVSDDEKKALRAHLSMIEKFSRDHNQQYPVVSEQIRVSIADINARHYNMTLPVLIWAFSPLEMSPSPR